MANTREKTAGAIIDIFFAKGAQISKKEYDEVLTILSEERSRVLEEAIGCVPEEKEMPMHQCGHGICDHYPRTEGHNLCREKTLANLNSLKR